MKIKIILLIVAFIHLAQITYSQSSGPYVHAFYTTTFLGNAFIPHQSAIHNQQDYSRAFLPSFSIGWKKKHIYYELEFVDYVNEKDNLEDVTYQEDSYYFRVGFGKYLEGVFKTDKMRLGLGLGLGLYSGDYEVDFKNTGDDFRSKKKGITIGVIPRFQYKVVDELVLGVNITSTISDMARVKTAYGNEAFDDFAPFEGNFSLGNLHFRLSLGYYFNLKNKE